VLCFLSEVEVLLTRRLGLKKLEGPKWSERTKHSWMKENNPHWNPNPKNKQVGNDRARRLFNCPKGKEIHHIDGNPFNNSPDNIEFLTRKEHMTKDGRVAYCYQQIYHIKKREPEDRLHRTNWKPQP
jgi:hypothetical protein